MAVHATVRARAKAVESCRPPAENFIHEDIAAYLKIRQALNTDIDIVSACSSSGDNVCPNAPLL